MKRFCTLAKVGFVILAACLPAYAQLSGAVQLGRGAEDKSDTAQPQPKQIAVTGIGANPDIAEKQAITDAVRQAVGAYVDANTLVQNEEVIKDRILSVSNGFVREYKILSSAKQREDGLYEVQILATVETTQVVNALKDNNLISGDVTGSDMWAQASTRVTNAQDAMSMLQAKLPELIKSAVTITPLDEDGKPLLGKDGKPSTAPAHLQEDPASGVATLEWRFEMGIDRKYYEETFVPLIRHCLDALMGAPSKALRIPLKPWIAERDDYILRLNSAGQGFPPESKQKAANAGRIYDLGMLLIEKISANLDSLQGIAYPKAKRTITVDRSSSPSFPDSTVTLAELSVTLLGANDELLAEARVPAWQPFSTDMNGIAMVGPYSRCSPEGELFLKNPLVQVVRLRIPIDKLKEIKIVAVELEPTNFQLTLGTARH